MRCIVCESFSFSHICSSCQNKFLSPKLHKRELRGSDVYTFYNYEESKDFLLTKHSDLGFYIYHILAKNTFEVFAKEFSLQSLDTKVASIAIDDMPKTGYSHTAILNKALKSNFIKPYVGKLHDKSGVNYSGKTRAYRELHPRRFEMQSFKETQVILVDDIITTGITFEAAIKTMQDHNKEVLFCLALADAAIRNTKGKDV